MSLTTLEPMRHEECRGLLPKPATTSTARRSVSTYSRIFDNKMLPRYELVVVDHQKRVATVPESTNEMERG